METLSVLPDGRIALCKMVHGTEITLVFQGKEKYGKTSKSGRK